MRGWQGEALTGVGPDPLLGEGGPGKARDGCGAGRRTDLLPPLIRRCGGTFPQGKVGFFHTERKKTI